MQNNEKNDYEMGEIHKTSHTIDYLRSFNNSAIDFLDTFKEQNSNINSDEHGEKMIRALINMNNEMEILKSDIIKIIDEKTKMELLKEIDFDVLNKEIINLNFKQDKNINRSNIQITFNTIPKKNVMFEKKEIDILNKIVEKDIKELDNEIRKQNEIIQSFQRSFSDESNININ